MLEGLPMAAKLAVTLCVGIACGLLFKRMRVPAGYMVGAFVAVALLNCAASGAWVPDGTRTAVQIVAGAFVGCSMERSDLARLRKIGGPVAVMLAACLVLMLAAGACIAAAGATSEDTTLPMMMKYTDEESVVLSVLNGAICSVLVPVLINACYRFLG